MTDLDKAREEYKHALRSTYVSRDADECGRTYGLVDEDKADTIIAALEAEVDRLRSLQGAPAMTDKPAESAVERYGHWCDFCQMFHTSMSCYHPSNRGDRGTHPTVAQQDAALAELKAELETERHNFDTLVKADNLAIASVKAENEALRREVERLKVCGLCCHCVGFAGNTPPSCNSPDTVQDEGAFAHFISDVLTPCHFTPSRWQRRES